MSGPGHVRAMFLLHGQIERHFIDAVGPHVKISAHTKRYLKYIYIKPTVCQSFQGKSIFLFVSSHHGVHGVHHVSAACSR